MKPYITTLRALAAVLGRHVWWRLFWITILTLLIPIALLIWATTMNAWWWVALALFIVALLIAAAFLIIFHSILSLLAPRQTAEQKEAVAAFMDKLEFYQGISGTPKFIIAFRLMRSLINPEKEKYLQHIIDAKNLRVEFQQLVGLFQ